MFKKLLFVAALISAVFNFGYSQSAATLTSVQIMQKTSTGEGFVMENITAYQTSATIPYSGTDCVLVVKLVGMQLGGYGQPPILTNNGVTIATTAFQPYVLTSSGSIVNGSVHYLKFPKSAVTTGSFGVQARSYSNPINLYNDALSITVNP